MDEYVMNAYTIQQKTFATGTVFRRSGKNGLKKEFGIRINHNNRRQDSYGMEIILCKPFIFCNY